MSVNSKFPLLKLPLLAFEQVINIMKPSVVLDLAFSSKTFKSMLTAAKWNINNFEWIISTDRIGVTIYTNFRTSQILIQSDCDYQSEPVELNGTTVSLAKLRRNSRESIWFVTPGNEDVGDSIWKLDTLELVTEFLMSFVRCSRFSLDYSLRHNLLSENFFIWKHVQEKSIAMEFSGIFGFPFEMIARILKFVEENVKAEISRVEVQLSDSGSENLNGVFKNWIKGDSLKKLVSLVIYNPEKIEVAELLKGLDYHRTKFSGHHLIDRIGRGGEESICRDIQRESDGRWGTVVIDDYQLDFIVWNPEDEERRGEDLDEA